MASISSITPNVVHKLPTEGKALRNASTGNAKRQAKWRAKRNALAKAAEQPKPKPRQAPRSVKRQAQAAAGVAIVATVLTILSLTHLAHGIELLTNAPRWESFCMALGLDLAFVGCEVAMLAAATDRVRRDIAAHCKTVISVTMLVSAGLNGLAFGAQADGLYVYPAVLLGVSVPALIFALSKVSFTLASK